VRVERVLAREHRRDPALRPGRVRHAELVLGDDGDGRPAPGRGQRREAPGRPRSQHDDIEAVLGDVPDLERHQIPVEVEVVEVGHGVQGAAF
jgi:hypothetical protein